MNALGNTYRDLGNFLARALAPVLPVNVTPTVMDFGGQDNFKLQALGRAAQSIADAVHGGPAYPRLVKPADFAALKAFIAYAESDFALAGIVARDDAVDQPFSPDESHPRDQERL